MSKGINSKSYDGDPPYAVIIHAVCNTIGFSPLADTLSDGIKRKVHVQLALNGKYRGRFLTQEVCYPLGKTRAKINVGSQRQEP